MINESTVCINIQEEIDDDNDIIYLQIIQPISTNILDKQIEIKTDE